MKLTNTVQYNNMPVVTGVDKKIQRFDQRFKKSVGKSLSSITSQDFNRQFTHVTSMQEPIKPKCSGNRSLEDQSTFLESDDRLSEIISGTSLAKETARQTYTEVLSIEQMVNAIKAAQGQKYLPTDNEELYTLLSSSEISLSDIAVIAYFVDETMGLLEQGNNAIIERFLEEVNQQRIEPLISANIRDAFSGAKGSLDDVNFYIQLRNPQSKLVNDAFMNLLG